MKVNYTCKKCGWKTSIRTEWSDLKPKKCMGKTNSVVCNTSFLKNPDLLLIETPKVETQKIEIKELKKEQEHGRKERSLRSQEAQNQV